MNYNCGKCIFVRSKEEANEIKKELKNLGANEDDIVVKFVSGPDQYLIDFHYDKYNGQLLESLQSYFNNRNWTNWTINESNE